MLASRNEIERWLARDNVDVTEESGLTEDQDQTPGPMIPETRKRVAVRLRELLELIVHLLRAMVLQDA